MPQPGAKNARSPTKRRNDASGSGDEANPRPYNLRAKPLNFDPAPFKIGERVEIYRGAKKDFIGKTGKITKITRKVWILNKCTTYPTEITNIRHFKGRKMFFDGCKINMYSFWIIIFRHKRTKTK